MGGVDSAIADAILEHSIDLLRLEAGTRARVLRLLDEMQYELTARLANEDLTAFGKARLQTLLRQASEAIDSYYLRMQGELELTLQGVADVQAAHVVSTLNTAFVANITASLPTETFLARLVSNVLIDGAPSADWWSKQELDTSFRFSTAVRQGVAQGETNEQIVARIAGSPRKGISGVMEISKRNARALVHTSIQAVANASRLESFRKNADVIQAVVWLATLDAHTCPLICGPRDLKEYTLEDDPPEPIGHVLPWNSGPGAIHWGCRCAASIKTKTFAQLGVDLPEPKSGQRASNIGPVPAGTDFAAFLDRKGAAFQDEVLGPGRAQLYRKGKLSLEQLLNLQGTPLTLAQLKAKYL